MGDRYRGLGVCQWGAATVQRATPLCEGMEHRRSFLGCSPVGRSERVALQGFSRKVQKRFARCSLGES